MVLLFQSYNLFYVKHWDPWVYEHYFFDHVGPLWTTFDLHMSILSPLPDKASNTCITLCFFNLRSKLALNKKNSQCLSILVRKNKLLPFSTNSFRLKSITNSRTFISTNDDALVFQRTMFSNCTTRVLYFSIR